MPAFNVGSRLVEGASGRPRLWAPEEDETKVVSPVRAVDVVTGACGELG